jgi:sensor histidine kinase YesM
MEINRLFFSNKELKSKKIPNYLQHIAFWFCFFYSGYFTDLWLYPNVFFIKEVVLFFTHSIFLFYSILFFLQKFSIKNKLELLRSISIVLLLVAIFYGLRFWLNLEIYPMLDDWAGVPKETIIVRELAVGGFLWLVQYFFFASAYYYFKSSVQKQKDLVIATEEKLTKEKENIQLENTALRAQINPHFLYNTLDFLYAKSLPVSAELSDGVMKLSDIMRYSLKPQDAEGLVYLVDEVEHIRNIIEMNQLRFDNKLNIVFKSDDFPWNVKIIPLMLITLVENVFKHGVTNSFEYPAIITLQINESNQLLFSTSNKKRIGPKEHSTGIGLSNTLKRLKNTYGDCCSIVLEDEEHYFEVKVSIELPIVNIS